MHGFFASPAVQLGAGIGAAVAIVAATLGVFTVIRSQAFAGESMGDIGTAGGAGAYLLSVGPVLGFAAATTAAAAIMELLGVQRARGRDLVTGVVLGAGFALSALLLYVATTDNTTSGTTSTVMFGSLFALRSSDLALTLSLAAIALGVTLALFRPLLLASTDTDLAAAQGLPLRLLGFAYLLALAIAVALAALTVGSILSTALLVGPAATALKLTDRPLRAVVYASVIGIGAVWLGLVLAYDSYDWPPAHHGWPASFFIVALVLCAYLAGGGWRRWADRRAA
ncbi:MAG: metal ABC transporter permease [Solirubrobacterales bacterium]|nr:metal ABC transporter permease [Solirubrobacterales bacterium]